MASINLIEKPSSPNSTPSRSSDTRLKTSSSGVILIPQPSDEPKDPLNWSGPRKAITTFVWCLGAFLGTASCLGNALGYFVQAKVYHKQDAIVLSYSVVASTAGQAVGPLVAVPLARRYGRSFIFFWSMVGLLGTGIWSATMTRSDEYNAFVVARLCGGFFGANPVALGADALVDIYFLHQRGKAFTVLNLSYLSGVVIGPTFSGFIVDSAPWPVQFWWTNGLEAATIILALAFLEDTYYDRTVTDKSDRMLAPEKFIANRMATFFCGARLVPLISWAETARLCYSSFIIGICPVTLLCGGFTLIDYGFAAFVNILLTVFLQDPLTEGGYAFTPIQNAAFLFCLWFGVLFAQLYGHLTNDRIPLWLCRRRGGGWQPEYRLHTLWLPGLVILPLGLGLFGASLQYHWHYMVLAVSSFLIGWSTTAIIPVTVNYIIECFKEHASAAAAIMGLYRLAFSLTLPFFVPAWMDRVGSAWCLGMAAFFSIFAYSFILLLMWQGRIIRQWSFASVSSSEEGLKLVNGSRTDVAC